MIPPQQLGLPVLGLLSFAIVLSGYPQEKTSPALTAFPSSVWQEGREITQIPWSPTIGKPSIRFDLRYELTVSGRIQSEGLRKNGASPELVMFARATEQGKPVSSVHPVQLLDSLTAASQNLRLRPLETGGPASDIYFEATAIVRSGKYRVELALLDRKTGKYNTWFENISVEDDPVERAFQNFGKFEFAPNTPPEKFKPRPIPPWGIDRISILAGQLVSIKPVVLTGSSKGFAEHRPVFTVEKPGTTRISVITILSPPDQAPDNPRVIQPRVIQFGTNVQPAVYQHNLLNLLSVVTSLDAPGGYATLTAVDLVDRTRIFDRVEMKDLSSEMLESAFRKDTSTVSLDALTVEPGAFFRGVVEEHLKEAENDTSGARHAILVVAARSAFPKSPKLTIPRVKDCHCQVFYLRFALTPDETDDIDNILSAYKPHVFEPLSWEEFREDFGKIYGQLKEK